MAKPSGARNAWNKNMLTVMGNMTIVASLTKKPVIKAREQINSMLFKKVIKQPDAASPSLKSFTFPVNSGVGIRLKRTTIDENKKINPNKTRTIITAILII